MSLEERMAEMQVCIGRIDERTSLTHDLVVANVERNDDEHKVLHARVSSVASRQNRVLAIGSACGAALVVAGSWLKDRL